MSRLGPFRQPTRRLDLDAESAGLPISLVRAIEGDGGMWFAGDWYTPAEEIVAQVREAGAVALRVDARDVSFLADLPNIRYLHVRTDGRPPLEPIAGLRRLRALILEVGAVRGDLDVVGFPELRWLRAKLGGKGGALVRERLRHGHPALEWLAVHETREKTVEGLVAAFPALSWASIGYADGLRSLGPLAAASPRLRGLSLHLTGITRLDGLEELPELEVLDLFGGDVADLGPVGRSTKLRYARLLCPDVATIEPLRGHRRLRLIELGLGAEPDPTVLDSMPELVAIGRGKNVSGPLRHVDLFSLRTDDPLRVEWREALRG